LVHAAHVIEVLCDEHSPCLGERRWAARAIVLLERKKGAGGL
jgi:hypothetical protein